MNAGDYRRRIGFLPLAALLLALLLGPGCAIERLGENVGKNYNVVLKKQASVRLTERSGPQKMSAEDAKVVDENLRKARAKSSTAGGGSRIMSLVR